MMKPRKPNSSRATSVSSHLCVQPGMPLSLCQQVITKINQKHSETANICQGSSKPTKHSRHYLCSQMQNSYSCPSSAMVKIMLIINGFVSASNAILFASETSHRWKNFIRICLQLLELSAKFVKLPLSAIFSKNFVWKLLHPRYDPDYHQNLFICC